MRFDPTCLMVSLAIILASLAASLRSRPEVSDARIVPACESPEPIVSTGISG